MLRRYERDLSFTGYILVGAGSSYLIARTYLGSSSPLWLSFVGVMLSSAILSLIAFAWARARARGRSLARRADAGGSPLPRFWDLFRFFVWGRVRKEVYEPAHEELKADYLQSLLDPRYRDPFSQRVLKVAFTFRTVVMVVQCLAAALGDRVTDLVSKVISGILTPPQG